MPFMKIKVKEPATISVQAVVAGILMSRSDLHMTKFIYLKVLLFIKKSDGEGTDFYYMGQVTPAAWEQTRIQDDKGRFLPIMNFQLQMSHPVREDIYQYFVNE